MTQRHTVPDKLLDADNSRAPQAPGLHSEPGEDPGASRLQRGIRVASHPFRAPRGIVLSDLEWVADISRRYDLKGLEIPSGSIVLERIAATGGRCFCYPDGKWLIGLSMLRLQRCGRKGVEGIVAHELLHAWLWSQHRYQGHGPVFEGHAAVRGIPRWCPTIQEVRRLGPQQLTLFDTWPSAPLPNL